FDTQQAAALSMEDLLTLDLLADGHKKPLVAQINENEITGDRTLDAKATLSILDHTDKNLARELMHINAAARDNRSNVAIVYAADLSNIVPSDYPFIRFTTDLTAQSIAGLLRDNHAKELAVRILNKQSSVLNAALIEELQTLE